MDIKGFIEKRKQLVQQIVTIRKKMFKVYDDNVFAEQLLKDLKAESDSMTIKVAISLLEKYFQIEEPELDEARNFLQKYHDIIHKLHEEYDIYYPTKTAREDRDNKLSMIKKEILQALSKQISLESIAALKFLSENFYGIIRYEEFWDIHDELFHMIKNSQNILFLLIPEFDELLKEAKDTDFGYNEEMSILAFKMLNFIESEEIIPILLNELFQEKIESYDPQNYFDQVSIRPIAANLLGKFKTNEVVNCLVIGLDELEGIDVIISIINSLGEIKDKTTIQTIYRFIPGILREFNPEFSYDNDNPRDCIDFIFTYEESCRKAAIEALQKLGIEPNLETALIHFTNHYLEKITEPDDIFSDDLSLEGFLALEVVYKKYRNYVGDYFSNIIDKLDENLLEEDIFERIFG